MKKDFLKNNLTITLITILILTSTTVAGYKTIDEIRDIDDGFINQITNQKVITEELKQEISDLLNNNNSNRYLIITGGIRASSYFVKLPRLLTQRGLIFSGEIWYRSSLAVTFIFEKNNSRLKLVDFERGTHRLFVFGIGHSTFSRPHFFSCGRLTAITRIKPIII